MWHSSSQVCGGNRAWVWEQGAGQGQAEFGGFLTCNQCSCFAGMHSWSCVCCCLTCLIGTPVNAVLHPTSTCSTHFPCASFYSYRCHPCHLPSGAVGGPAHQPVPLHPQRTAPHHWVHRRLCRQHRTGCQCGRAGRGSSGRRQEGCSISSRAGELAQRSSVRGGACTVCKRLQNAAGVGAL